MKKKLTKQTSPTSEYDSQRETRVLLEEMNKGIKTIGEQHGTIVKRLDNIEPNLGQRDQELQIIKTTAHTIKATVHANASELNSVKMAVMEVDVKVNKLDTRLTSVEISVGGLEKCTERIEQKLDTTISQNEEKFKLIETKLKMVE